MKTSVSKTHEFGDVLVRKQAFLDNRNMDFEKTKHVFFLNFGQKLEVVSCIVFIKNRSRKCLLTF